jgi:hypothetical protein
MLAFAAPPQARASTAVDVVYTGVRLHVAAAAVVDLRALARLDRLSLWTIQEYARLPVGRSDDSGRWGTWWGRVGGGPPLARPRCVVPRVVGKPMARAWRRLVRAHCHLGKVRRVEAPKRQRGRVLRQRPAAGTRLPSDARVSLTVGR